MILTTSEEESIIDREDEAGEFVIEFVATVAKSIDGSEDQMLVEGWIATSAKDRQGEDIPETEIKKALATIKPGTPITLNHPRGKDFTADDPPIVAGYVVKKEFVPGRGGKIITQLLSTTAWQDVKRGILGFFSVGGAATRQVVQKAGVIGKHLSNLEISHIMLCRDPVNLECRVTFAKSLDSQTTKENSMAKKDTAVAANVATPVVEAGTAEASVKSVEDRITQIEETLTERLTKLAKGDPNLAGDMPEGDATGTPTADGSPEGTDKPEDGDASIDKLCEKVQALGLKLHNELYKAGRKDVAALVTAHIAAIEKACDEDGSGAGAEDPADPSDESGADVVVGKAFRKRLDAQIAEVRSENVEMGVVLAKALGEQRILLEKIAAQPDYTGAPSIFGTQSVVERGGNLQGTAPVLTPVAKAVNQLEPWLDNPRYGILQSKVDLGQANTDDRNEMARIRTEYKTLALQQDQLKAK